MHYFRELIDDEVVAGMRAAGTQLAMTIFPRSHDELRT
jgi:hypothetical protein